MLTVQLPNEICCSESHCSGSTVASCRLEGQREVAECNVSGLAGIQSVLTFDFCVFVSLYSDPSSDQPNLCNSSCICLLALL